MPEDHEHEWHQWILLDYNTRHVRWRRFCAGCEVESDDKAWDIPPGSPFPPKDLPE